MSVKVSSWVWHGDECGALMGSELVLMLSLADVADDNGRCRYLAEDDDLTYDGLARKVRVDRRTIERLIPKLRKQGLLSMQRGSKSRPNEFTIVVPWAQISADKVSGNAEDSPTSAPDSPTSLAGFPDIDGVRSSSIRTHVVDVVNAHDFDEFWSVWPRKNSKKDAQKAWDRAVKKTDPGAIIAAARAYAESPYRPETRFVPYGASWLNGERWNDPLPEPASGAAMGPNDRVLTGLAMGARLQAEFDQRQKSLA